MNPTIVVRIALLLLIVGDFFLLFAVAIRWMPGFFWLAQNLLTNGVLEPANVILRMAVFGYSLYAIGSGARACYRNERPWRAIAVIATSLALTFATSFLTMSR